jgi:hypothetical protein
MLGSVMLVIGVIATTATPAQQPILLTTPGWRATQDTAGAAWLAVGSLQDKDRRWAGLTRDALLDRYQLDESRPGGGLAPGAQWPQDCISWTPETALVPYTASVNGRCETAERWMD